jgi:hypothetical protein
MFQRFEEGPWARGDEQAVDVREVALQRRRALCHTDLESRKITGVRRRPHQEDRSCGCRLERQVGALADDRVGHEQADDSPAIPLDDRRVIVGEVGRVEPEPERAQPSGYALGVKKQPFYVLDMKNSRLLCFRDKRRQSVTVIEVQVGLL